MKRTLSVLLALVMTICMLMTTAMVASAAETDTQSGIEATLVTDKDAYSSGEDIKVTVNVKNTNTYDVNDVSITVELPEGLTLKSGNLSISNVDIAAGETYSKDVIAVKETSTPPTDNPTDKPTDKPTDTPTDKPSTENPNTGNNDNGNTNSPQTGDSSNMVLWIVLMMASAAGIFLTVKFRKNATKFLSLFLCVVMVCAIMPTGAFAAEGEMNTVNITVDKMITVDGSEMTVKATISGGTFIKGDEASSYRVTFDANDGSAEVFAVQVLTPGEKAIKPTDDPERELYRFTGWYTEPAAITEYDFNTEITGNLTLYAGWGAPDGSDGLYSATNTLETIYSITGIDMEENGYGANVTINTNSSCILTLEFFNDNVSENWSKDNLEANLSEEPIASVAVQTPDYGEMISVQTSIDAVLPEYYLIRARLMGENNEGRVVDLCDPYVCIKYTKQYALFENQTIDDFTDQNVVNFDEDKTTNFGVLNNSVKNVYMGEDANILTVQEIDTENDIIPDFVYTFANPDNTITGLQSGDIIYIVGTTYLFKIKTVSAGDGTISFTPDKEAELADFYNLLKVDMSPNEEENGIMPMAEVIDVDGSLKASIGGNISFTPGGENSKIEITGSLNGSATLDLEITYDFKLFGKDYFYYSSTVKTETEAKVEVEVTLASNEDAVKAQAKEARTTIKLPKAAIPVPIPAVTVYIEPTVPFEWSVTGNVSLKYNSTQTKGFSFDTYSGTQRTDKKESSVSFEATGKVEATFGPKIKVGIQLGAGNVSAGLSAQAGIKISATAETGIGNDDFTNTVESKHACGLCIDGTAKWFVEAKANLSYKIIKNILEGDLLDVTIVEVEGWINFLDRYPGEFFFSILNGADSPYGGHKKFGGGSCQNKSYRTELVVVDENENTLQGRPVSIKKQGGNTNKSGNSTYVTYLYDGIYKAASNVNGSTISKTFITAGNAQTVTLSPNSSDGKIEGQVKDSQTGNTIQGAAIKVSKDGLVVASAESDMSGSFAVTLPDGEFLVEITRNGYIPFSTYEKVENAHTTYMQTVGLIPGGGMGGFRGNITDAVTAETIPGVTLQLRSGWNNTAHGDVIKTLTTGSEGEFKYGTHNIFGIVLGLKCGNYTLSARKNGYLETSFNIVVLPGLDDENPAQNATMSPAMTQEDTYRIVLTWDENPNDLDSHVKGTLSNGNPFHVYYEHKSQYDGDIEVCNLDVDDTTSYGPETITLNANTDKPYYYYIFRYAGSGTVATSGAQIKVYHGTDPVRTFNVPTGLGDDDYWNVFAIKDGQLITKNTITSSADTHYAD